MNDEKNQSLAADIAAAFLLLTRIPVPWHKISSDAPDLNKSVWAYPLVGCVVGGVAALVYAVTIALALPPVLASLLGITALILITGAFHEDGLADVADGLGGGQTRERKLEIMRDSRIGTYGALALLLSLGLRTGSLSVLSTGEAIAAFIIAATVSRALIVAALYTLPPARTDSLSTEAGKPEEARLLAAFVIAALVAMVLAGPMSSLTLLVAAVLAAAGMGLTAKRLVGGYTGDVLGGIQQVSEIAVLLALAALWGNA